MMTQDRAAAALALDLERHLGAPNDPAQEFSYARRVEQDEAQVFPRAALAHLDVWGLHHYYVPVAQGGKLAQFDVLARLVRSVSSRDLAVSISHAVTFLGAMCVWVAGTPAQQQALAERILAGERASFALTEKAHGSDLLAMETRALPAAGGFLLDGEKWLINGAGYNALITVFARTDGVGPRGFSLFQVHRDALPQGCCIALPKIETMGIRASNIAGIRFDQVPLTADAMIGRPGSGLETALKGLQLSRTLCSALALGAAETGLAVTLDFAGDRRLYGKLVRDIPQCQRLLAEAWADILLADCLAALALRCLQACPGQASVHSAVTKYLVPVLVEAAFLSLSTVIGARWYLRHEHAAGIFQKMLRDNLLIGLFDGSSMVNLHGLSFQLKALINERQVAAEAWEHARAISDRSRPLPDFDWTRLSISNAGADVIAGSLEPACAAARATLKATLSEPLAEIVETQLNGVERARRQLVQDVRDLDVAALQAGDPAIFEHARIYTVLSAAAALLIDIDTIAAPLRDNAGRQAVLAVALARLNTLLGQPRITLPMQVYRDASDCLAGRRQLGQELGSWRSLFADSPTSNPTVNP